MNSKKRKKNKISANFRCKLPFELENTSYHLNSTILQKWYPFNNQTQKYSSCSYRLNNTEQECHQYIFDDSLGFTVPVQFGLTCKKDYLIASTHSFGMIGFILGGLSFGLLSDRFGRKKTYLISILLYISVGSLTVFAPNIWVFLVAKLIIGTTVAGSFLTGYVLLLESSVPEKRVLAGSAILMFYPTSNLLCSLFGYLTTNWKHLELIYSLFAFPCLLYYWLVPESPRWLITKGRLSEASVMMQRIAKDNRVEKLPEELDSLIKQAYVSDKKKEHKPTLIDALRYKTFRKRMFLLAVVGLTFMVYYAIIWGAPMLNGNLYLNIALMGMTEIPGMFLTLVPGQRFGRRPVIFTYCLAIAVCVILIKVKPLDDVWVLCWVLAAKSILGSTMGISNVYVTEIYPTVLRSAGGGLNTLIVGAAATLSPYIIYLHNFWEPLPNVVLALIAILCGVSCLFLPETFNKNLPETLEEADSFGR